MRLCNYANEFKKWKTGGYTLTKDSQEEDENIEKIMHLENQGGDLNNSDYFWYIALGIIFPAALLLWGWF